jgi:pimeloyl-ACP methyl ester carboxylesterase
VFRQGREVVVNRTVERAGALHTLDIDAAGVRLQGDLAVPEQARGLVIFAHGSGSSRQSPRNRSVAEWLREAGWGTLLFDLLTPAEAAIDARTAQLRFDIGLLASRLVGVTDWIGATPEVKDLPIGYFGASTGAAAALVAAALRPERVAAVVSRGGRPDLAGDYLAELRAPTLLLVGGDDVPVIALNRQALARIRHAVNELVIIPRAGHLFEEPGTMEQVAEHARRWFRQYLG